MIGRVYVLRGEHWRVVCRWAGRAPRNVLVERVELRGGPPGGPLPAPIWVPVLDHLSQPIRIVRPFRGFRRI